MIRRASIFDVARSILSVPQSIRVKPATNWFLCQYMRKFTVIDVDGNLVLHSHLPPLNSTAYGRFVREHLLVRDAGPSHAQIGLTNACPQNCSYCYSKEKRGKAMDTVTVLRLVNELKRMGVFWLGLTGGEPLLNKDIARITEQASVDCAVKLFTTGSTLTVESAVDLRNAGLFSVSVSLDHWKEEEHDRIRNYRGAFRDALKALEVFKSVGGIHVGVSAVLSREMIQRRQVEEFLAFLGSLGIHEAWLSEPKPSIPGMWENAWVISEAERLELCELQDRHNKLGSMTVNYLGHFEAKEHFGCAAGNKMLYVDACGDVSPCVFLPLSFGNVGRTPIQEIYAGMRRRFPTENRCCVNETHPLLRKHYHGKSPLDERETLAMMEDIRFAPMARFFQLHYS
jgi:MoaA/NifB/PqqE/SkfB family radical SAM enzyme